MNKKYPTSKAREESIKRVTEAVDQVLWTAHGRQIDYRPIVKIVLDEVWRDVADWMHGEDFRELVEYEMRTQIAQEIINDGNRQALDSVGTTWSIFGPSVLAVYRRCQDIALNAKFTPPPTVDPRNYNNQVR